MFPVLGNIHVHSLHSDGSAGISDIALAAAKRGLHYLIITDHHTLRGQCDEGYHHGVLVLVGSEINEKKHHYLALGVQQEIPANDEDPQTVINEVNAQGGLGFIAHPFETGSSLVLGGITYPWLNWEVDGFTGIEVWNWCSQFRDGIQDAYQALYYAYIHPEGPIKGPCQQAFARFDEINRTRRLTAIAGSDAHDWHIRRGPLFRRVFPYQYLFRTANNCLLLEKPLSGDVTEAKEQILAALRYGRCYIVNGLAAPAGSFSFTVRNESKEAGVGESIIRTENTMLKISCAEQKAAHVGLKVILNGRLLCETHHNLLERKIFEKGTYRVEIRLKQKPWIYTNPIYVE